MSHVLPMLDIENQTLCRSSVNSSYTQLRSTGVEDATVTAWRGVNTHWSRRPPGDTFLNDIESLAPTALAETIGTRLAAMPEHTDLSFDAADLRKRHEILNTIRGRSPSRIARSAEAFATSVANEAAERLRTTLDTTFACTPHAMRQVIEQTRAALAAIKWPEPASRPLSEFASLVRALDELSALRAAFTAADYEAIIAQLTHQARRIYEEALREVAVECAVRACRLTVEALDTHLDELLSLHTRFDEHINAIESDLEAIRTEAAAQNRVSRASVIVPLVGADECEVLAGMVAQQRCSDLQELSADLLDRLTARLQDLAASRYPWLATGAPLPRLIAAIDPSEAALQFNGLIQESLGPGHTLYQVIKQYGVPKLACELFQRAAHTCHLRGRDNERFNLSTQQMTIVRLPPPAGAADCEIRRRLRDAFERLTQCTVTEGSPDDKDVTVVRLHQGWVLAIEHNNPALLRRYVRSADADHRPHLLGVFDDSPTGEISPKYRELAETSDTQHDQEI